jgi:hypothetical protein
MPGALRLSPAVVQDLALDAVQTVRQDLGNGQVEVDVKNYAKVEKIPGGTIEESKVLKGVMFNKDVVSPGRMRRKIVNPRIILLDCPLEYKKGESQTNVELSKEEDWCVPCCCGWCTGNNARCALEHGQASGRPLTAARQCALDSSPDPLLPHPLPRLITQSPLEAAQVCFQPGTPADHKVALVVST